MKFFNLFILTFLIISCNDSRKQESKPVATVQAGIEKIKLAALDGKSIDMKQYKGKTVFVNFWATWCRPCVEEMPTIKNVKEQLKEANIEFLFASDETDEQIQKFEAEHKFEFNYYRAGNLEELNIMGLPTTFIFDKNGKQVFSELGYRKWDDKINIDLLLKIAKQE